MSFVPTSGHTCQMLREFDSLRALKSFVIDSYSRSGIGIELAFSVERGGSQLIWPRRTPQPTSSELQRAQKTRAALFHCFWSLSAPRVFVGSLDWKAIMRTADTPPGESNAQIISSIINLVCPQCGGGCRNSNVKGDAAETGLQNGMGESGDEKLQVPAAKPSCPVDALSWLECHAYSNAVLG